MIFLLTAILFCTGVHAKDLFLTDPSLWEREIIENLGKRINEVEFDGSPLSDPVKDKFQRLKGTKFELGSAHQIVNWFQETGGDARLEVKMVPEASGVVLKVTLKERPKIAKVVLDGVSNVSQASLLALLELKDGSEIDSVAVEGSAQKIIAYYVSQGFTQITVKPELDKDKNLHFFINEGPAAIVGDVEVSPIDSVGDPQIRRRLEADLLEGFGLAKGDRLVQEKINDGILEVRSWLRSHDFLTAKEPSLKTSIEGDGRVHVRLIINYGSRIKFGFRNNSRFSHRELQSQIAEVKEVNVGVDYIESVRRKIIDSYKDVGLVNVKINTIVRDDPDRGYRFVSLILDEGERVHIDNLRIDGLFSLNEDVRKSLFFSFAPRLVQREYFQEAGIQRAGELLAEHLRSRGYLSAKLEFTRFDFSEDHKKVSVFLLFNEGVQSFVRGINLVGLKNISEDEARQMLGLKVGDPFNVYAFEKGLVSLKDKYQDLGHLTMTITNEGSDNIVVYSKDQTDVTISVKVEEGPPIKLGSIIVRGNSFTHTKVITRELPIIPGDILTRGILKESEDNIRKLNLFTSVIVRPIEHPGADDTRDLLILVEEGVPGSVEFTPGFRNDLGVRAALGVSYQNLGGWHRGASAKAIVNRRIENYTRPENFPEYNISFGFREPYFANWPVTFTSNLVFLRHQFNRFDANISRITAGFRRDLTKYVAGLMEYSYERSSISNTRYPYAISDEGTKYIGAMIPGVIIDSRNDKFNPVEGIYSASHFEWADQAFGSKSGIGYYRVTTNNSAYTTIMGDLVFASALNIGFERSNVSGVAIPVLKLFRLGGIGSIRGYQEDGIEVESSKSISGTLTSLNYRGEMRFPFYGSFGGALFYDAGNLLVDQFTNLKVRSSAGFGLRYNTPVGPVLLDIAKKLQTDDVVGDTQTNDQDRYRVHFAIGVF